jgi:hypothetical protein
VTCGSPPRFSAEQGGGLVVLIADAPCGREGSWETEDQSNCCPVCMPDNPPCDLLDLVALSTDEARWLWDESSKQDLRSGIEFDDSVIPRLARSWAGLGARRLL